MTPPSWSLATSSPDDTRASAAAIARSLQPGDVVTLSGELGAGKTCFVQGAARELGVKERVTSPTFVLMRHYQGSIPIVHCDVYRLDRLHHVDDLGDEVLAPDVVTFIEWGDAIAPVLPPDRLEVEITRVPQRLDEPLDETLDDRRTVLIRAHGPGWADRAALLDELLADWK